MHKSCENWKRNIGMHLGPSSMSCLSKYVVCLFRAAYHAITPFLARGQFG